MNYELELLKKRLDEIVDKKGIDSREVLALSQQIDSLIAEYYRNSEEKAACMQHAEEN